MDVFGVRSKFCGQTKVKTQRNAKNKMGKIVKPVYVVKQRHLEKKVFLGWCPIKKVE